MCLVIYYSWLYHNTNGATLVDMSALSLKLAFLGFRVWDWNFDLPAFLQLNPICIYIWYVHDSVQSVSTTTKSRKVEGFFFLLKISVKLCLGNWKLNIFTVLIVLRLDLFFIYFFSNFYDFFPSTNCFFLSSEIMYIHRIIKHHQNKFHVWGYLILFLKS